ncbi:unnamed protein product, partial [Prorocentrum cordatum]
MKLAKHLLNIGRWLERVSKSTALQAIDPWVGNFFASGFQMFSDPHVEDSVDAILARADEVLDTYGKKCLEGWKTWAASSSEKGAGQAHRHTRAKAAQEIYDWGNLHNDLAQPHVLADKSM